MNVLASFDLQLEFFGQPARNSVYEDEVYFKFTVRDFIYTSSSNENCIEGKRLPS